MNDKIIFKKIRKRNRAKEFLLPFNIINLSNSSLKDLTLKPINKIKDKHINYNRKKKTISKGTNAIYSIVNNGKNKNKINSFNDRKIFFPCFDETKYVGDGNPSTIHSNGKFQNSINSNEEKILNKVNDKFIIRQKIKKFILNNNGDNIKLFEKMKKNKEMGLINNNENNKNNLKNNLKALHISSHYLGNIIDDKFGIVTNKFSIDKNLILTHSKPNKKYLNNNYNPYSLVLNIKNDPKLKFITLNMPDRSNFFNLVSSSNLFSKMKDSINNQKLYQQLMSQMSQVFKKRIKKYCILKSYEKNHKSLFNI